MPENFDAILIYVKDYKVYRRVRDDLISSLNNILSDSDEILINNEFCKGKGEATAALMNQTQIKDGKELLEVLKVVFEFLQSYEYFRDEKKIYLILDGKSEKIDYRVNMMNKMSENRKLDIALEIKYEL